MKLGWKEFTICIECFNDFLIENVPSADGIVADDDGMTIVEKTQLSQNDKDVILNYYNNLTETGENDKILYKQQLIDAFYATKEAIINKDFSQLTIIEKKILMNVPLTVSELESLL